MLQFSDVQLAILHLLADGKPHLAVDIAKVAATDSKTVQKHLQQLAHKGLDCIGNGAHYQLPVPLQLLSSDTISRHLSAAAASAITSLEVWASLASSNRYLAERSKQGAGSGSVCFAEHQSAGYGRSGRCWLSPLGGNIHLSLLWHFPSAASVGGLSLAVGVAVMRALQGWHIAGLGLKWPNDILAGGRKLGGVLVEVIGDNNGGCYAVVGLGLNLHLSKPQQLAIDQPAVGLHCLVSDYIDRNRLAATLLQQLLLVVAEFGEGALCQYVDEWRGYDSMAGLRGTVYRGKQKYCGTLRGIDDSGRLLLEDTHGIGHKFASGEISFRPEAGRG